MHRCLLARLLWFSLGLLCVPGLGHADMSGSYEVGRGQGILEIYELAREADPLLRRQIFELDALREQRRVDLAQLLPQASLRGSVYRTRREQIQSGLDDRDSLPADTDSQNTLPANEPGLDPDSPGESAGPDVGEGDVLGSLLRKTARDDVSNSNGLDQDAGNGTDSNGGNGNGEDTGGGDLSGNGDANDPDDGDPNRVLRNFTQTTYGLTITQALLDFPARYQLRRGDSDVLRGEAELESERQALVSRVAEAYIAALAAQSTVELARQELRTIRAAFERVEAMYAEKMAAVTDLDEIRARLDLSRAAVIRAQGSLDVALERLSEITNARHGLLVPLQPEASLPVLDPDDPEIWVETAFATNPELKAASQSVTSADARYRAARAQGLPTLDLVGRYTYLDDLDGTAFGRKLDDWAIGVELNVPLFAGGGISAGARAALNTRESERQSLEALRRSIRGQVRASYWGLKSAHSQVRALEQSVRSSERSLEAVDAGYMAGLRPLVDLLDAQRELFATRLLLTEERHNFLLQLFALRRAAGVLDEDDIVAFNDMLAHRH